MPRLRKQSIEQRSRSIRLQFRNYREDNSESERIRNSQTTARLRQNEEYRENERQSDRISRATRRENVTARISERVRNTQQRARRREESVQRLTEQVRNSQQRSQYRENPVRRAIEQTRNTQEHSQRRENPVRRAVEQTRNTLQHAQQRENPVRRAIEQTRDTLQHSQQRENPVRRAIEQTRNTQEHYQRRENPVERAIEQTRNTLQHSQQRDNPVRRAVEQIRNTQQRSQRREDPIIRSIEQVRNTREHFLRRANPSQRAIEQARNTLEHSGHRQNPDYQEVERERNTISRSVRRSDPTYRTLEQTLNTSQRREARHEARTRIHDANRMMNVRVRIHRINPNNRDRENLRQAERNRQNRQNLSPHSRQLFLLSDSQRHAVRMMSDFNECIKKGPTEVCVCCGGLWFPNQIKNLNKNVILNQFPNSSEVFFLSEIFPSENNIYKFCNTCHKIVKGGKIPTICLSKGLHFPTIPDELKGLTALEERFVAPRIPFMRIVSLGYNRQCAIRGAVVNVPISLSRTVDILPRRFDQTEVIQVHLKRRLEYNHSFMTETIRPAKIYEAARYLVNTDLYRAHSIVISEDWLNSVGSNEEVPFVSNQADEELVRSLLNENLEDLVTDVNPQETLLENNPIENFPLERISIAPGEGQVPLDILFDEDSEELSFPSIYCGIKNVCTATIAKAIKSKARRFDRRCARVDVVLYLYKKLELSRIKSSISTCLRKKIGENTYLARQVLDDNFVRSLIQHDEGYHVLKGIRSSPAHWEGEKKKVLAMIRQFGLPTFFITISAAESQWPELIVILAKIVENKDITEEEAMNYTTQEKYSLVRQDPITCSRYFDQRVRHLFKHFNANGGIFGEHNVVKYYWRIEFQQRGSPHVHGIYWLKNAPSFNINDQGSFPEVVRFIDRFITTDSTIEMVQNYISYQEHNHSRSCQREVRGNSFCRFRIPYPPMPNTEILLPLPDDTNADELKMYKDSFDKVQSFLNTRMSNEEVDQIGGFEQFLANEKINLSYEEYILALRSSLKKPQIFLKRSFKDKSINAFNPNILAMQRANMDIQYIMDAYACVSYIVNYINKSNRGVSRLLQEAMEEIREGNFGIKERLQHIGNKFISGSEISAQEASYNILSMNLSQCSNAEVFINTFRPEKRVRMLKSRQELENMPSNSTDVFKSNLLDHYVNRPDSLDEVCLAKFAACYSFSKKKRVPSRNLQEEHEDDYREDNDLDIDENDTAYALRNNGGFVYERRNPAIIRFPTFNADGTRGDYFRALAMLYLPWKDEREELLESNTAEKCNQYRDIIEANRLQFEIFKEGELEEILQQIREEDSVVEGNVQDNIAATQILDDEFRAMAVPDVDPNTNVLNIPAENNTTDESNQGVRLIRLPVLISECDLLISIRSLNVKQRMYLQHLLQNIAENKKFYEFVGGGAGVGKSRLIKTIYHSITQRFNSIPGSNHELPKVLLSAPTGKAAFSIGGSTLHALFSLPINQYSGELRPLSNDIINSLIAKFIDLKLIIIDEISMVGSRMLGFLDSRLKQIFKSSEPFGGMSVLVFGDLKQLPPVGDKWIFKPDSANPYGIIVGTRLWDLFKFYELTDIMRQRDDLSFAQALNNMAVGQMTEENIRLIESRLVSANSDIPSDAIHLFVSNAEAEAHNILRMNQILTEEFISDSFDIIKSDSLSIDQREQMLTSAKFRSLKPSETQGLCSRLVLKISAKYMMTVNVNISDGLVNGASGVLMGIDLQGNSRCPTTLWVLFCDEKVGLEARRQKSHPTEPLWTPIEKCVRSFQFKNNMQITIERRQFPLVIAEGITIHKSQGATYSKVAVHLRGRMQRSSLYVACSRATSASGLFIIGRFNPPNPFEQTDPVKIELDCLRLQKSLTLQYQLILSNENYLKLFYQNIQSLHAHFEDITSDPMISYVDLVCLVETWTLPSEEYVIPNFSVISRLDSIRTQDNGEIIRNRKGIMIYINNSRLMQTDVLFKRDHRHANHHFQYIVIRCMTYFYMILYKNIDFPVNSFQRLLINAIEEIKTQFCVDSDKIFIIGDFNLCRRTVNQHTETLLNQNGFTSLLDKSLSTTNHGTHIDWAFANISDESILAKTYTTIHSHHDGIVIGIGN